MGKYCLICDFYYSKNEKHLPILWWTPLTPCTGLYIPIFIDGDAIPEILSKAGTFGKANIDPSKVQKDEYLHNSYWWIFKELLDIIKGDEFGSRFNIRQKIVREVFDNLENRWEIELRKIEKEAIELKFNGQKEKASKILADFTKTCVEEAIQTVNKVKKLILEV